MSSVIMSWAGGKVCNHLPTVIGHFRRVIRASAQGLPWLPGSSLPDTRSLCFYSDLFIIVIIFSALNHTILSTYLTQIK